jgi:hypothetical protein
MPKRSTRAHTVSSDAPLATDSDAVSVDAAERLPTRSTRAAAGAAAESTLHAERTRHDGRRRRGANACETSCVSGDALPAFAPVALPHQGRSRTAPFDHRGSRDTPIADNATSQLTAHFHSGGPAVHSDCGTQSAATLALSNQNQNQNHRCPPSGLQVSKRADASSDSSIPFSQPEAPDTGSGAPECSTKTACPSTRAGGIHSDALNDAVCDPEMLTLSACSPARCAAPSTDAAPLPHGCPPRWQHPESSLFRNDHLAPPQSAPAAQPCLPSSVAVAPGANGLLHTLSSAHACDSSISPSRGTSCAPQQTAAGSN